MVKVKIKSECNYIFSTKTIGESECSRVMTVDAVQSQQYSADTRKAREPGR